MGVRSLEEIERDFAELLASRLPNAIVHDQGERLWDETNEIAVRAIETPHVAPCLDLLKRMQATLESRYGEGSATTGGAAQSA
jgi:hypothetical protein